VRRGEALFALLVACAPEVANQPAVAPIAPSAPRETSAPAIAPPPPPPAAPAKTETPIAPSTTGSDQLVERLLSGGGAALKSVLAEPQTYRFEVLYAIVHEGPKPTLERHAYRADAEYFFPASSMKMPITLAAYDRLAVIHKTKPALTRDATLRIHPVAGGGEPFVTSLARETTRALIVSDNFSANRLLAFVGHREVHEMLWSLGLASARVHHGFATGADIDPAEVSPKIEVVTDGNVVDELAARKSDLALPTTNAPAPSLGIGEAAIVDGRRVPGPMSFAEKNAMRLSDLQDTLVRIMRPELLPPNAAADAASKDDLAYVKKTLGTLPSESGLAGFDRNVVADYQLIPFLRGIERVRPRGHFEIHSKVGQAFGFLIGNAYIVDKDTGKSFFLVAAVFANPDGVMNDDIYAYDTVSFPALADVAEVITRHAFAQ
jgi:hypothetical protein